MKRNKSVRINQMRFSNALIMSFILYVIAVTKTVASLDVDFFPNSNCQVVLQSGRVTGQVVLQSNCNTTDANVTLLRFFKFSVCKLMQFD